MKKEISRGEVIIYTGKKAKLEVKLENDTVWLSQAQIASLFDTERSVITKHLRNIFASKELEDKSNVQKMHIANSDKPVNFYNLDVILSVGYRVNSKRATQFRIWATSMLRNYLIKGYAVNEKRLLETEEKFKELQDAVAFLQAKSKKELLHGQESEILDLLASYAKTLSTLEAYDTGTLKDIKGTKSAFILQYEACRDIIRQIRTELAAKHEAGDLFGSERDESFSGIIRGLYQTFGGKELYQAIEDKAAHVLYLTIKDHPFSDGNKRIGSFLFVYVLDKSGHLYRQTGEKKINDNALTALALLIAESDPKEKEIMITIIKHLIAE